MKMGLLVLISSLAFGQDPPKDAPFAEGRSVVVQEHEAVPFGPALCLEETEAKRREWIAQRDLGELERLRQEQGKKFVSVPVLVAIIAGSVAVGAAVGAGVAVALHPPPK
jgi:hypothetical protein